MAEGKITLDIEPVIDEKKLEKDTVKALSESGQKIAAETKKALVDAEVSVEKFAKMSEQIMSGIDFSPAFIKATKKAAIAGAKVLKEYNKLQTAANKVSTEPTAAYQEEQKHREELSRQSAEFASRRKAYEDERKAIELVRTELEHTQEIERDAKAQEILETRIKQQEELLQSYEKERDLHESNIQKIKDKINAHNQLMETERRAARERGEFTGNELYKKYPKLRLSDTKSENFVKQQTTMMGKAQAEIDKTKLKIAELQEQIEKLDWGKNAKNEDFWSQLDKAYTTYGAGVLQNPETLETINNELSKISAEWDIVNRDIRESEECLNDLGFKYDYIGTNAEDVNQLLLKQSDMYTAMAEAAKIQNAELEKTPIKLTRISAIAKSILGILKNIGKHIVHSIGSAIKGLGNAVRKLASHFKTTHKSSRGFFDDTRKRLKDHIRLFLQLGLGLRSVFFLYKRLRSAAKEALGWMAKDISEVNQQMSSLATNAKQLKATLGSMIQPLLKSLVPAFEKLTQVATKAMETIAMFIATLTGQGYFYRAKANWVDYAEEVGNANDKVKELKDNVLGIDELNILKQEDEGGAGKIEPTGIDWEKVPVDDESLIEKLKNIDFSELGKIFSDKILAWLTKLYDSLVGKVHELLTLLGKDLAEFLNGIFQNMKLAEMIGKVIGAALNDLFDMVRSFVEKFNWRQLGEFIATEINAFFHEFNWTRNAETIAMFINGLFKTLLGFAEKLEWGYIGQSIVDAINKFLTTFSWRANGEAIGKFISGIIETMYTIVSDKDLWANLGDGIVEGINGVLSTISWDSLSGTITSTVNGLIDAFHRIVSNSELWMNIQDAIKSAINTILNIDWTKAGLALGELCSGIVRSLYTLVSDKKSWQMLGKNIANGINAWAKGFNWKLLGETASNLIDGLLKFMIGAFKTVNWQSIGRNIADFINGIDWGQIVFDFTGLAVAVLSAISDAFRGILENNPIIAIIYALFDPVGAGLSVQIGEMNDQFNKLSTADAQVQLQLLSAEYENMVKKFGEDSDEAKAAYDKLIEAQQKWSDAVDTSSGNIIKKTSDEKIAIADASKEVESAYNKMKEAEDAYATAQETYTGKHRSEYAKRTEARNEYLTAVEEYNTKYTQLQETVVTADESAKERQSLAWENFKEKIHNVFEVIASIWRTNADVHKETFEKMSKTIDESDIPEKSEAVAVRGTVGMVGAYNSMIPLVAEALAGVVTAIEDSDVPKASEIVGEEASKRFNEKYEVLPQDIDKHLTQVSDDIYNSEIEDASKTVAGNSYKAFDEIFLKIPELIRNYMSEIAKTIETSEVSTAFEEMGIKCKEGFYLGFEEKGYNILDRLELLFKKIRKLFQDSTSLTPGGIVGSYYEYVGQLCKKKFTEQIRLLVNNFDELMEELKEVMLATEEQLTKSLERLQKAVTTACNVMTDVMKAMASAIASAAGSAVSACQAAGSALNVLVSQVSSAVSSIQSAVASAAAAVAEIQSLQSKTSDASSSIQSDVKAAQEALASVSTSSSSTSTSSSSSVPHLAGGAVIPPNHEFLAVLGDQKSGTNIEAPLSTIQEAVASVLEPYLAQIAVNTKVTAEKDLTVAIGDREIAKANMRGSKQLGFAIIS